MKTLLFFLVTAMLFYSSNKHQHPVEILRESSDTSNVIIFAKQIQPILVNHCSPCHFTGGKMYEKLPFDNQETIIGHETGILRRIKNEKESTLIKEFVKQEQLKPR
jgi:hypothetical protein